MTLKEQLHHQIQDLLLEASEHVEDRYSSLSDAEKTALICAYMQAFASAAGTYFLKDYSN